jgi:hypothetical protein
VARVKNRQVIPVFEVYRIQVKDAWGLWVDVADFDSEEKARRFIDALKRDFPNMELRVVRERIPIDVSVVVACIVAVIALSITLGLIQHSMKAQI